MTIDTVIEARTGLVPWVMAPDAPLQPSLGVDERDEDAIKAQVWPMAFEQWLAGGWRSHGKKISGQTRRAYQRSVTEFQEFIGGRYPMWRVMGSQVIAWRNAMRTAGLSETTINLRLSGLSSMFEFVCHEFPFPDPRNGSEMFLMQRNPVKSCKRTKINPYESKAAFGLNDDEILGLLRKIDKTTVVGLRDYALITTLFWTGQRSAAIAQLKWGDITHPAGENSVVFYRWESKAKEGTKELVRPAYDTIVDYLHAAGRLETMRPENYIFMALSDVAERLPNVRAAHRDGPAPLTGAMVNRIVKKWARRAGLDERLIHTHTLRHSAALFMKRHGVDLLEIQKALNHSNPNTTMIYLKAIDSDRHPLWKSVGEFFEMV
jgi:site-specific recombinase XerD